MPVAVITVMKGYSTSRMVVQTITGVLNPAVAQLIKNATADNPEAGLMAHTVWGALAAQLGGKNAAAGAAGAFSGELAAQYIINHYYGGKTDNLSEQQKQQISMLATIASGIAGGLAGNSTAAAGTGAQAGKNAAENNALAVVAPTPVPAPGVPISPGDQVTKDANDKIASAVDDFFDAVDKSTQCSFGRACSSDDSDKGSKPNVAGNMTDEEKTELGGAGIGTPGGHGPEEEQNTRDKELSSSDKRSIKSLEEQIKAHEDKLAAYKRNPEAFDNQGYLSNAPNDTVRQSIINGRIRHLENEIKTFRKNINEIRNGKG